MFAPMITAVYLSMQNNAKRLQQNNVPTIPAKKLPRKVYSNGCCLDGWIDHEDGSTSMCKKHNKAFAKAKKTFVEWLNSNKKV